MIGLPTLESVYNYFIDSDFSLNRNTPAFAQVIFYPENRHTHCFMRIKNIQNLWANYSAGDRILVEDDVNKLKNKDLNLSQIGDFAKKTDCWVEGWQEHESCLEEAEIKREFLDKIDSSIKALSKEPLLFNWEESLNYLISLSKVAKISAWEKYTPAELKDFFTNKKKSTERNKLLNAMEIYARNSETHYILQYFPKHQNHLKKRISQCAKSTNGKVHVFNGIMHTNTQDPKTGKYASELFNALEKKNIGYYVYE